jgi:hypothetical protein
LPPIHPNIIGLFEKNGINRRQSGIEPVDIDHSVTGQSIEILAILRAEIDHRLPVDT